MSADARLPALIDGQASAKQRAVLSMARQVAAELQMPIYLVGGAVRDLLSTGQLQDLDLAVEGDGLEVARRLADRLGGDLQVHARFLTAEVMVDGLRLDVVTTRHEEYEEPAALPTVSASDLAADLARRDFTINSMAFPLWPEKSAELIDPFRGREDLANGWLRVLHERSFFDDPTRILRGVRLGSRLQVELEPQTRALAVAAVSSLAFDPLSASRLRQELLLLLEAKEVVQSLRLLEEIGFLGYLGMSEPLSEQIWSALEDLSDLRSRPNDLTLPPGVRIQWWLTFLMAAIAEDPQIDRHRMARRLDLDEALTEILGRAADALAGMASELADGTVSPHRVREMLDGASPEEIALLVATGDGNVRACLEQWHKTLGKIELGIGGAELISAGFAAGPEIGRALKETLEARVDGLIGPEQELEFAVRILRERGSDRRSNQ